MGKGARIRCEIPISALTVLVLKPLLIYMRAGILVAIRVGRGRENNFEKSLQTLLPLLLPIVLLVSIKST